MVYRMLVVGLPGAAEEAQTIACSGSMSAQMCGPQQLSARKEKPVRALLLPWGWAGDV
jgi:hypothetical protein